MSYRLGQYKRAKDDFEDGAEAVEGRERRRTRPTARAWAAEARYYEGELIFRDYEKVTLDVKPSQLNAALKKKKKLLDDAEKVYLSVVDYSDLKWATAALYRVGQIYDGFSEALANAAIKPPAGPQARPGPGVPGQLNEYVVNIQDIAVQAFSAGYQKAIQMQVYDEYTAKIRAALGRLAARQVPAGARGARARSASGDRPPTPELVTEVAR